MIKLIVGLIATLSLAVYCLAREGELQEKAERRGVEYKPKFKVVYLVALIPLVVAIATNLFVFIPANTVGIHYSPFSGVKTETLTEGFHAKGIFDKVYKISTEVQTKRIEGLYGQTRDAQYLTMNVDIKYTVNPQNAFKVFKQFKTLDNVDESLITPTVQRSIEAVTTQYNIIEVLGEKRNNVYKLIEDDLRKRLSENGIDFYSITFSDTDAGDAIEKAIEREAIAKKEVEVAEQERARKEIEVQKQLVEAEANKKKAEIDAQIKIIEAEAERKANEIISQSLTENLLKKMEMEARMKHGWITITGANTVVKQ